MENTHTHNRKPQNTFNPIAWGILFFSFWLSLQTITRTNIWIEIISWSSFVLSIILWLSIFITWLRGLLNKQSIRDVFLPLIFFVSIFGFVISWISGWLGLEGYIRDLSIVFGFLWILVYLIVLIRGTRRVVGILAALAFIGLAIYRLVVGLSIEGFAPMLLGLLLLVMAIWKPRIWYKFPF